jgi:hypothetical protein
MTSINNFDILYLMNYKNLSEKNKLLVLINKHRKIVLIAFGILAILTIAVIFFISTNYKLSKTDVNSSIGSVDSTPAPVTKYYSPLTGNQVDSLEATKQAVTGIMIENSPDARPQSGLKESGVVFETIAESTITRFLAIYQEQKPQLIGPVRSVRLYYVDWIAAFDASVAHIGGSQFALKEVRNGNYRDIDQFFNSAYYWRATDRYAPHNVYTSFEKLDALNSKKGYTTSNFTGFTRKDSSSAEIPTASTISVKISETTYNSAYIYDKNTNTYLRSVGGKPHMDREKGQISPRVVVVMKAKMSQIFEDGWRESIETIGSGDAYIFQDGLVAKATWTKASKKDQIKFTDSEGKDVPLARGQTWITAVPKDSGDVSWQ